MALDKKVFLALAAVAWADGTVDPDEADAIVRAAIDCGLDLDDVADVEAAAAKRIDLASVDVPNMGKEDRLFVYAIACWIAEIDGARMNAAEAKTIAELGERLGIPEKLRARAEALMREIAALPEDRRPARYDLDKLRALVSARLVGASKA